MPDRTVSITWNLGREPKDEDVQTVVVALKRAAYHISGRDGRVTVDGRAVWGWDAESEFVPSPDVRSATTMTDVAIGLAAALRQVSLCEDHNPNVCNSSEHFTPCHCMVLDALAAFERVSGG